LVQLRGADFLGASVAVVPGYMGSVNEPQTMIVAVVCKVNSKLLLPLN